MTFTRFNKLFRYHDLWFDNNVYNINYLFSLTTHHSSVIFVLIDDVNFTYKYITNSILLWCRLENEHLNNAGKFRAVKIVPLPFHEVDEED